MSGRLVRRVIVTAIVLILMTLYFLPWISIARVVPDLFVLLIAYLIFRHYERSILWIAFAVGLLRDLFSSRPFGVEAFSFSVAALAIFLLCGRLEREEPLIQGFLVFLWTALFITVREGLIGPPFYPGIALPYLLGTALYTTLVFPLVFSGFDRFLRRRFRQYEFW